MTTLSERIRPGIDAAPWVIQAIKELEQQLATKAAEMQATVGVGDGTGSLYVHGSYDAVKTVQTKLLELESVRRQLAAKEEELKRAGSAPAVQREPVGRVKTVGGYPDESEHTVEWLCKYKDLKNGDLLYATPQPAKQPAVKESLTTADPISQWIPVSEQLLGARAQISEGDRAMNNRVCKHGQLGRTCPLCELEEELNEKAETIAAQQQVLNGLAEMLGVEPGDVDGLITRAEQVCRDARRYQFLKNIRVFRMFSADMSGKHTFATVGRPIGNGRSIDEAIDAEINKALAAGEAG